MDEYSLFVRYLTSAHTYQDPHAHPYEPLTTRCAKVGHHVCLLLCDTTQQWATFLIFGEPLRSLASAKSIGYPLQEQMRIFIKIRSRNVPMHDPLMKPEEV